MYYFHNKKAIQWFKIKISVIWYKYLIPNITIKNLRLFLYH